MVEGAADGSADTADGLSDADGGGTGCECGGANEVVERVEGLVEGRRRVELVLLVQVDPGGAQPREAVLHSADDVSARCPDPAAGAVHGHGELRGEDDVIPARPEDLAQDFLGRASVAGRLGAIDIGGVKEGDPGIQRGMDDGAGRFQVDATAEIIAA